LVHYAKDFSLTMTDATLNLPFLKEIPPLGFGCCPMGGHGWGRVHDEELRAAVATALDLGVRLFDTSDVYGLGASEVLLGEALRGRRDHAVIATKFGVRRENGVTFHDTTPAWITKAAEASLRRLKTDRIDLYQMHYWDGVTPLDVVTAALESLRKAGKIRAYGVTNHDPRISDSGGMATYSYHYNLVHREHEDLILGVQQQTDLLFMSWGSLGQGVLSGAYHSLGQLEPGDRRHRQIYDNFHGEKFAAIQVVLEELKSIATANGIPSVSQLALRWIVDRIPRAIPLVGIKRPAQIIDAAGILRIKLDLLTCAHIERVTRRFKSSSLIS
jgi:myo-inositol catabolism protein IolS